MDALLDQMLTDAADLARAATWIGVAGTMTTLAGVYLGLASYDRQPGAWRRLGGGGLDGLLDQLARHDRRPDHRDPLDASRPRRRDHRWRPGGQPGRPTGTVSELVISESDIFDGIAMELLA